MNLSYFSGRQSEQEAQPHTTTRQEKIKGFKLAVKERRQTKESRSREALLGSAVLGKSADEHGRAEDMQESMMEASRVS